MEWMETTTTTDVEDLSIFGKKHYHLALVSCCPDLGSRGGVLAFPTSSYDGSASCFNNFWLSSAVPFHWFLFSPV